MAASAPVKMRVMCDSTKGKIKTYAVALSEAFKCRVDDVPPAYSCDKERLVLIVASLKGEPSDKGNFVLVKIERAEAFALYGEKIN